MSIAASFGATDMAERRVHAARRKLALESKITSLTSSGHAAEVLNISSAGMLLKTGEKLAIGERILVSFDTGEDHPATIMWSSDSLHGSRFDEPISKGILSAALLRSANSPARSMESAPQNSKFPPYPNEDIGLSIAQQRKVKGLTQADLAARIGVSKTTVWKWENGAAHPRRQMAARLAELLATPLPRQVPSRSFTGTDDQLYRAGRDRTELQTVVSSSKEAIAQAAGTTSDRITIHIEI